MIDDIKKTLWATADKLRANMDAAEYKHLVLGLIFVKYNGSISSSQNNEGQIRAAMVDADVVEVMIALPGQLFFNTQIPACLWFLAKGKRARGRARCCSSTRASWR